MKKLVNRIMNYSEKLETLEPKENLCQVSREKFAFLLSGVASFRKVPGIPQHMGFEGLYHCDNEQDAYLVREHLQRIYNVKNKETLISVCNSLFSGSEEYEQIMTFFRNAPVFNINELKPHARKAFERCKEMASYFYPLVEERGFYAWDINERIGLCRVAVACDMISEADFYDITSEWVKLAQVFYHSYEEYAISCVCGAMYQMVRYEDEDLTEFLSLNEKILDMLFCENGPWRENAWYEPEHREWVNVVGKDMVRMGCFITKRALDEEFIGYMYRDEPDSKNPDSGWRFMYGDEDQEYIDNTENTEIVKLNTVCNLYPDILAFIHAEPGRGFSLDETGWVEE